MEVVILLSSVSGDHVVKGKISTVEQIMHVRGVSPVSVDAADPANKEKRDALFRVSGVRGNFPQVFIHDTAKDEYQYVSFEQLEGVWNQSSNLWSRQQVLLQQTSICFLFLQRQMKTTLIQVRAVSRQMTVVARVTGSHRCTLPTLPLSRCSRRST
jgi:hypothetical protein